MQSTVEHSTTHKSNPPRTTRNKRTYLKIDPEKVKRLHKAGLSQAEIAENQGVRPSTIWRFLDRTKPEEIALQRFKSNRADELASIQGLALSIQHRLLQSIDRDLEEDCVQRMIPIPTKGNLLNAVNNVQGTVFDKERLERGESTSNVSIVSRMVDSRVTSRHTRKALESLETTT